MADTFRGQVCKAWLSLIYDGQLWSNLDLRAFPKIPASQLLQVAESAGSFITSFNLSGHGGLLSSTLEGLANHLSVTQGMRLAPSHNQLTYLNMSGCSMVTTSSLHYLLSRSPFLETSLLGGMSAVTNETCEILFKHCSRLKSLDMSRCKSLTGAGIQALASSAVTHAMPLPLVELRLSGLKGVTDSTMAALGRAAPYLEVLDLSYSRDLHNSSLDAFVACTDDFALDSVSLTARQAGRNPNDGRRYRRRITRLRHLSLSSCTLLTDIACSHLAYAVPQLELLELGGIGGELKDDGIIRLLQTLPNLRKLDLEDASDITDNAIRAITPSSPSDDNTQDRRVPGHALEHLIVSHAVQLSNDAFLALMRNCTRLRVLEADSTRLSVASVKEFVKLARERNAQDATIVAIDCRSMNEAIVKELTDSIRPRLGWRAYEARRLAYLDGRDNEALGVGQDECDSQRVVLKTFASWQTVDAVAAARSKHRKGWRRRDVSGSSGTENSFPPRSRWWSPGGRRSSGINSPSLLETNNERDGCTIM
jgi:F-box and leucine-rich repeat protein 2/20